MILLNLLLLSVRNFKRMRLRSMLTVLGIGIGIGAILFLVSLGQGLQRLLITRITTAEALLTLDITPPPEGIVKIDQTSLETILALPSVNDVSPVKVSKANVAYEGVRAGVTANFIDEKFFRLSGLDKSLTLEGGKDPKPEFGKDAIFVSRAVLNLLSIKDAPFNLALNAIVFEAEDEVLKQDYYIKGVLEDEFNSFVYFPLSSYPEEILGEFSSVKVQVVSTQVIEQAREEIIAEGFVVSALSDTVKQANRVFRIMQVILAIFGIVALTVAAIGMFNTMTIALLERTTEIGIMRAIGASKKDIWLMFLVEAFLIGFLGGVSGVLTGVGLAEISNAGLNLLAKRLGGEALDIFYYPMWFIISVVLFSTVVAVITGFYPAQRAANLNPLDALRYK